MTGGAQGISTRYVYITKGLRIDAVSVSDELKHPCNAGVRSRWIKVTNCTTTRVINNQTRATFVTLLSSTSDTSNANIRDIFFPNTGLTCHSADVVPNDPNSFLFTINVNGQCFQNTHPDNFQVYDFTPWVSKHPGGAEKIKAFANVQNTSVLTFPGVQHGMDRWSQGRKYLLSLGREGDVTTLKKLPPELLREDIAQAFGSNIDSIVAQGKVIVCGSPFEVATVHDENSGPLSKGKFEIFDVLTRSLYNSAHYMYIPKHRRFWHAYVL